MNPAAEVLRAYCDWTMLHFYLILSLLPSELSIAVPPVFLPRSRFPETCCTPFIQSNRQSDHDKEPRLRDILSRLSSTHKSTARVPLPENFSAGPKLRQTGPPITHRLAVLGECGVECSQCRAHFWRMRAPNRADKALNRRANRNFLPPPICATSASDFCLCETTASAAAARGLWTYGDHCDSKELWRYESVFPVLAVTYWNAIYAGDGDAVRHSQLHFARHSSMRVEPVVIPTGLELAWLLEMTV